MIVELPGRWGCVAVHSSADRNCHMGDPRPHARVADGRTVIWHTPPETGRMAALDAESVATVVPAHVGRWLDVPDADALTRWTKLEVMAKLTGTPVLLLLRDRAEPQRDLAATFRIGDLVVSVGWAE